MKHRIALVTGASSGIGAATVEMLARGGGRIDILVNSAGIIRPGGVEISEPEHWREMIDINLLSAMYLSKAELPCMHSHRDATS